MSNDPVRYILERFTGWWEVSKGWRKLGIATIITIMFTLYLCIAIITLTVWLVKSLTVGGTRNKDLYIPRMGRKY